MPTHAELLAAADAAVAAAAPTAAADPLRPRCHFTAQAGWINDPNGLIHMHGRWHLFFQHNPFDSWFGNMHWGHASSVDLVHWTHHGTAMAPGPAAFDAKGAWSGCIVNDRGLATMLYTGVAPQCQCLAVTRDPQLEQWEKFDKPVIPAPPADIPNHWFRDPWVWRDQRGLWHMIVGAATTQRQPCILHYRSSDLRQWQYVGKLLQGEARQHGRMWECPSLLPLGDKWLLVVSPIPLSCALYAVGDLRDDQFVVERWGTVDHGIGDFYAPFWQTGPDGQVVLIAWVREQRTREAAAAAGWAGVQCTPRTVQLGRDGLLRMLPVEAFASLRRQGEHLHDVPLVENMEYRPATRGGALEIALRLAVDEAGRAGLRVAKSDDGSEQTTIVHDRQLGLLMVQRERSSLDRSVPGHTQVAPLRLADNEPLHLRVILDRSLLEVFDAGGRAWITTRVYPSRADSAGVEVFTQGGRGRIEQLDIWPLRDCL